MRNFDRVADRYDATRGGVERGTECARFIGPHLPADGLLLEVGVGTGLVAHAMGPRVVGVDISTEMLGRARERLGNRVARTDGVALPFPDGTFAGGYSVWVFHLIVGQGAVFDEIARVLTPGGRYLIETTERFCAEDGPIERVMTTLYQALLPGERSDADHVIGAAAAGAGLDLVEVLQPERRFEQSPAQAIHNIETRAGAAFWDLDDETWTRVVEPALDELRSLPDPARVRVRRGTYPTLVLQKPRSLS